MEHPKLFGWVAMGATAAVLLIGVAVGSGENATLRALGVSLLLPAAVFKLAPFFLLHKHGQMEAGESYMQTTAVVDRGVYALTRHPQYLGYMLLACGFALLSQHWATLLLAAVTLVGFYGQAVGEEQYCLARLGEPYRAYMRRVPRFNVLLGMVRAVRRSS